MGNKTKHEAWSTGSDPETPEVEPLTEDDIECLANYLRVHGMSDYGKRLLATILQRDKTIEALKAEHKPVGHHELRLLCESDMSPHELADAIIKQFDGRIVGDGG